jgi:L-seryl-tRNA(Ser) seleniumtransferase
VSRGELVEIGGAFRVPEIVRAAGAVLVFGPDLERTNRWRFRAAARRVRA